MFSVFQRVNPLPSHFSPVLRCGQTLGLSFSSLLVTAGLALAQAESGAAAQNPVTTGGMLARMAVKFLMVFMIFQVLVIKPQKRKLEEQTKLAAELRKGDQVVTTGGILGRVVSIEKDAVTLEVASGVRVKFEPSSIVRRIDPQQQKEAA